MSGRLMHIADRRQPAPRLSVRITSREPLGRSRPFKFSETDLDELIEHAERLERRASL